MEVEDDKGKTVSREEFEAFQKRVVAMLSEMQRRLEEPSVIDPEVKETLHRSEQYCPQCETYTRDLYEHLKKNPEKHGLVKEVVRKRAMSEVLAEHDLFDCPDCRKVIDEHLAKKDLEITEKKREQDDWLNL